MASLFLDLGSSLLESQLQAGKEEIMLRKNGSLELNNTGRSQIIEWKGREIHRLSLSHYDFGYIQDRITAKQVLTTLVANTINPKPSLDAEILAGYQRLQRKATEWTRQYEILAKEDAEFADNPFFTSRFLSVGHLLLLLDGISGNDAFAQSLEKTKHLSFSSSNFYYEHLNSGYFGPKWFFVKFGG